MKPEETRFRIQRDDYASENASDVGIRVPLRPFEYWLYIRFEYWEYIQDEGEDDDTR